MTTLVTRAQWGAAAPESVSHNVNPTEGVAIHHVGAGSYAYSDHANCTSLVRAIQRMHMANTAEGYVDVAYNLLACHHGFIFEGRSKASDPRVRPGSNGTSHANTVALSVCCLWGDQDGAPSAGILAAAAGGVAWLRKNAKAGARVTGHRDWSQTSCPGHLYSKLGAIKALADRGERPDRDGPREPRDIIVATYNTPHRLGPQRLAADVQRLADEFGASLIALQETTDVDHAVLRPDGWDWYRPARAQSSTLVFDRDVWEPMYWPSWRRRQGSFKVSRRDDRPRFVVHALLKHKATGKVYRFGGVHLPAFKTRGPVLADKFRHAEKRAAKWLGRSTNRILLGDLNANKGSWTPNLGRFVWEHPTNNGTGPHGTHIDHVLRNSGRRPTVVGTMRGCSDHEALVVRL